MSIFKQVDGYSDLRRNTKFYYWNSLVQEYVLLLESDCEMYSAEPEDFNKLLVRYGKYCTVVHLFDLFIASNNTPNVNL